MMNLVPAPSTLRGVGARLRGLVPEGRRLPERVWSRRHRGILVLLWMHAVGIAVFAAVRQFEVSHVLLEAGAVGVTAVLAGVLPGPRRLRSVIACFGLMTSSALLVHLSGGYIEFHFHFFVMVGLLALYQDWTTFILAIGYVVVHHGVVGVLDPQSVYNHGAAWAHPWLWAGIHGAFSLAMSAVTLTTWRVTETASALTEIVLDSAGEGVVGVDLQGRTTFVNAAAARMLRCSAEDLIGRPLGAVILHPPDPAGAPCRLYANMSVGPAPDAAEDFFRAWMAGRSPSSMSAARSANMATSRAPSSSSGTSASDAPPRRPCRKAKPGCASRRRWTPSASSPAASPTTSATC